MIGTMVVVTPANQRVQDFNRAIALEDLTEAVGGHIEVVPHFNTFGYRGTVMKCVAFCNEEGKLNGLPVNPLANVLWERALNRAGNSLYPPAGKVPADVLVGDIAIVFGDREFMETL